MARILAAQALGHRRQHDMAAEDGRAGVEAIAAGISICRFVEIFMPETDRIETVNRLRKLKLRMPGFW